jgi:hypothetical protein
MSDDESFTPEEQQLLARLSAAHDEGASSIFMTSHPEVMPLLMRLMELEADPPVEDGTISLEEARSEATVKRMRRFEADCLGLIQGADMDEDVAIAFALTTVVMRAIAIGLGREWVASMFAAACDASQEQVERVAQTDPAAAAAPDENVVDLDHARFRYTERSKLDRIGKFNIDFLKLLNRPSMNSGAALMIAMHTLISRAMELNLGKEWIAGRFENASEISRVTVEKKDQ